MNTWPTPTETRMTHKTLLAAKQTLIDAAVNFALIAETEPCVSGRYDAAQERLNQAARDYTECSLRVGLTHKERIG